MLTIVIPVHNQKKEMVKTVEKLSEMLRNYGIVYEIIIAEDGSTDGSYEVGKKLSKKKNIRLTHRYHKSGKGAAIKRAAKIASYKKLVFSDADMYDHMQKLKSCIKLLENYDIVIGSRYLKKSKTNRKFSRKLFSYFYNYLVRLIFRTRIKDHQCGFKAFSTNGINLIKNIESNGYVFDTELLVRARNKNLKIKEIPINWSEKKNTKLHVLKDGIIMFLDVLKLRIKLR